MLDSVDVWYVCEQTLCNFDCSYCVTQAPRRQAASNMWLNEGGEVRYRAIVEWLAALPWRLRLRLATLGEPFVSSQVLAGAAWLSKQKNIEFVELLTNGSFRHEQFRRFADQADVSRITLWITYHPTEIEAERVVEAAAFARSLGAFVVVHGLLFPDSVAAISHMKQLCQERDLLCDVTAGHNYNAAYGEAEYLVLGSGHQALSQYRHQAALQAMLAANQGARGRPCSAGHDYFHIRPSGDVYPCSPYSSNPQHRMGSALDPTFVPQLRAGYSPCEALGPCGCKEDYLHLQIARSSLQMGPSLGYYQEGVIEPGRLTAGRDHRADQRAPVTSSGPASSAGDAEPRRGSSV
jgi:hypothetical protein